MEKTYTTISGDTWDMIAKEIYGDEARVSLLMESNQDLLEYFVFPDGIVLKAVDLPEDGNMLPDWRK